MLVYSNTHRLRRNMTLYLENVSEIIISNFGETTLKVNDRTVKPGFSITFSKCHWIHEIELEIIFQSKPGKIDDAEISYLTKK